MSLAPAVARRMRTRLGAMQRELAHGRRDSVDLLRAQLYEMLIVLARQYAGQRAKRLLDSLLASRARRMLLSTDESAARVGASLGFEDPSYFSRFFRRETGQTLKECRNALHR